MEQELIENQTTYSNTVEKGFLHKHQIKLPAF